MTYTCFDLANKEKTNREYTKTSKELKKADEEIRVSTSPWQGDALPLSYIRDSVMWGDPSRLKYYASRRGP